MAAREKKKKSHQVIFTAQPGEVHERRRGDQIHQFLISSLTEGMLGVEMGRNELTLLYAYNAICRCCEDAFADRCSLGGPGRVYFNPVDPAPRNSSICRQHNSISLSTMTPGK
jgi:hypothetical protein